MKKKLFVLLMSLTLIVTMMPLSVFATDKTNENDPPKKSVADATYKVASEEELRQAINETEVGQFSFVELTADNFQLKDTIVIPEGKIISIEMHRHQITAPKGKEALHVSGMLSFVNEDSSSEIIKGNCNRVICVEKEGILTINGKIAVWLGTIEERDDGGGILNLGTCVLKNNASVSGCKVGATGGAIANYGTLSASNCSFINCSANDGAAICSFDDSITDIENSTINHCSAKEAGGAICNIGNNADFIVRSSTITNCSAGFQGGAIATSPNEEGEIRDTTIENCTAETCGAITNGTDKLHLAGNCQIINNTNLSDKQDNVGVDRQNTNASLILDDLDPSAQIGVHLNHGWRTPTVVSEGGQASYIGKNILPDYDGDEIIDEGNGVLSISVGAHAIITFDSQGGSEVAPMEVGIGEIVGHGPEDPVRPGYYFAGWYINAECIIPYNFNLDYILEDTTLYAKWEKADDPTPVPPEPPVNPSDNTGGNTINGTGTQSGTQTGDVAMPIVFIALGLAAGATAIILSRKARNK